MHKTTLYFETEMLNDMDKFIKNKDFKSRNELVEKAVAFYMDYMNNNRAGQFLAKELEAIMSSSVGMSEKRLGDRYAKLMGEIAIQLGILQKIFLRVTDISDDQVGEFRKLSVDEIFTKQRVLKYEELR